MLIKNIFFLITFFSLTFCSKTKHNPIYYNTQDSIEFSKPIGGYEFDFISDNIFIPNKYNHRLELYSKEGKFLSYLGNRGKGPIEFEKPKFFDIYKDNIFLLDRALFKIVITKIDSSRIHFKNEFIPDYNIMDICALSNDLMLVTCIGIRKNIKLYNREGKLLKEYDILGINELNNKKDYYRTLCFVQNLNKNNVLFGSITTGELYFCKIDKEELTVVRKIKSETVEKIQTKTDRINNKEVNIYGLGPIYSSNNQYYVSFNPEFFENPIFEKYDKNGNFLGKLYLKTKKAYYFTFRKNKIFFTKLGFDQKIYIAKEEKH